MQFSYDELHREPYGRVEHKGKILRLAQQPYIDGSHEDPFYTAIALDEEDNEYEIVWHDANLDVDDQMDACNWEVYKVRYLA